MSVDINQTRRLVRLRTPLKKDLVSLILFWNELNHGRVKIPISDFFSRFVKTFEESMDVREVAVAEIGGGVVGFAMEDLEILEEPVSYLNALYVSPFFRGNGVGRLLLSDMAERACERGIGGMYLHLPDLGYKEARSFYSHLGFISIVDEKYPGDSQDSVNAMFHPDIEQLII